MDTNRALRRLRGEPVDRIPHWEHLSNPDFLGLVSGIDPYQHPRQAALKAAEMLPVDMGFAIPATDDPVPAPRAESSWVDDAGRRRVRWGAGETSHWEWGTEFTSVEQALAFEPLKHMDMRDREVVEKQDFTRPVEEIARSIQGGDLPPPGGPRADTLKGAGFYNTIFMWPLLTFGWEIFLELAGAYQTELKRLMDDFAVLSRKFFTAVAMTDVVYCVCHDDICMARGPVCSPDWLRRFVYPYYEEFWSLMKAQGIMVIFMTDGNPEAIADDIFACGADGLISEPFADYDAIARKHPDKMLAGDGDNRVLMSRDREAIEHMTRRMCDLGRRCPRYFMCIGNHIPWNVPPEAVQWYFEFSEQYGQLT